MTLGQLVRMRRLELNLKQDQMAEDLGISQPYLSDIERDNVIPKFTGMCKIGEYLKMNPTEIWQLIKTDRAYQVKERSELKGNRKQEKSVVTSGEKAMLNSYKKKEKKIQRGDG